MSSGTIRKVRSPIILGLDLVSIIAIFSSIYYLRLNKLPDYSSIELWLITGTLISALFLSGTYFKGRRTSLPSLPIRTFWICIAGGAVCLFWIYLMGPVKFTAYFGRGILPISIILCGIATTAIRFFINRIYHRQEKGAELLYLGYSRSADNFLSELKTHSEVRSITIASQENISPSGNNVTQTKEAMKLALADRNWQSVIIDPTFTADITKTNDLISFRLAGTPVLSLADFYEKYWYMIPIHGISDDWFLKSQGFSMLDNPISKRVKRCLDIILSILLLIVSIPIILLCSPLIKLTSKGPVLFKQTRVGLNGELFTIYKLRTMQQNAEEKGAQWAQDNDPRITKFGSFLRSTRLDELPQCWNVLNGTMSFIGPRPERPEFTNELAKKIPYYNLRHLIKPGITGWAQVIFPYGASVDDAIKKLQYELYYIKHQSLLLDLNIMLRTIITVFQRAGR